MSEETFYLKETSINFTVKNISPQRKRLTIFNTPIEYGATRDLLSVPEVTEDMIRVSLIKGELANKLRFRAITIISSSIDLTQFDAEQRQFLTDSGVTVGVIPQSEMVSYNDALGAPTTNTDNVQDVLDYIKGHLNLPFSVPNKFVVGASGSVDYHTVHEAITAAINAGASLLTPYEILINVGTYIEPPMTVPLGIIVVGNHIPQSEIITLVASNPNEDLFTMQGGNIEGIHLEGVFDPTKCLIRCDGYIQTAIYGMSFGQCSNGIIASNGCRVSIKDLVINLNKADHDIGTVITVTGTDTHAHITSSCIDIDPNILSQYIGDPITTCIAVHDNAQVFINNSVFHAFFNTSASDVIFADSGAQVFIIATDVSNANNGVHIGPIGNNTNVTHSAVVFIDNVLNLKIDSSTASANVIGYTGHSQRSVIGGAIFSGLIQFGETNETDIVGATKYQYVDTGKKVDLPSYFNQMASTGLNHGTIPNGEVTDAGGLFVNVGSGSGWIQREGAFQDAFNVSWDAVNGVALTASSINYIVYDSVTTSIKSILSPPTIEQIQLASVVTDGYNIRFLHNTKGVIGNIAERVNTYISSTRRIVWNGGLVSTIGSTNRKINVFSGSYFIALVQTDVDGYVGDASFSYFYGSNGATEVANQNQVDITNYDVDGVLTPMIDGYFRVDTLYITSDNRLSLIYGTSQAETQTDGYAIGKANPINFIIDSACSVARVLIQKDVGIISVIDARPIANITALTTGGSGALFHSALLGLIEDDHPQYLLASGVRSMNGALDMAGNSITNINLVDGVDVSAHASRHNPGGLDALNIGVPVATLVGASPALGAAASYALSDHQHGITAGTPSSIGTTNASGSASSVARSDHIHSHGNQTDGYLHAIAIASGANGFMTGADKSKLDGIATGATNSPLTSSAPINVNKSAAVVGVATTVARADHKHDVTTDVAVTTSTANTEGTSTSLARADHVHIAAPPSNIAESSTPTTTTSASDVIMAGMTLTPAAGTYLVWFTGDIENDTNGVVMAVNIYSGGVLQTASERNIAIGNDNVSYSFACMARVTVNGSQAITGNWRTSAGTANNYHRSLAVMLVS